MVRLQRVGRKHEPVFRLVLTDSKNGPKSGKFQEILGHFDARNAEKAEFKVERVKYWISMGAQLSDTVHNLLVERKVIEGKKINNLPKKRPVVDEAAKAAEVESKKAAEMPAEEPKIEAPIEETKPEEGAPEPVAEEVVA